MKTLFDELKRYPSAMAGLVVIAALICISIYTVIAIPYNEAIRLWRGAGNTWDDIPKNAQPAWVNFFRKSKLPETLILDTQQVNLDKKYSVEKTIQKETGTKSTITISFAFDYMYDAFPQALTLYMTPKFKTGRPFVTIYWATPDGREIQLREFRLQAPETYRISQDARLKKVIGDQLPEQALFLDPASATPFPLKGKYDLRISATVFDEEADLDAKFVIYGQVYGIAGTDHKRRDLMVALLWGTPIALAFGLLAAFGTTLTTMIIAAVGVWFGGWVDSVIQRFTEVNMILPGLPILVMVGTLYSNTIWTMLGVSILLNIFGAGIKGYRAIFMQVKESPYIEAARTYGAGNFRIVFSYLIPRIIPVLIPQLVNVIPTFVFLEATLAVLGLGDPIIPTWGKLIDDARANGALFQGNYYWVLEPSLLLMVTGLAFAMVGFALDRIFNPKLRGV
jgi:peptide/nickel transport system permease protein